MWIMSGSVAPSSRGSCKEEEVVYPPRSQVEEYAEDEGVPIWQVQEEAEEGKVLVEPLWQQTQKRKIPKVKRK